jgi:hypothetical protein
LVVVWILCEFSQNGSFPRGIWHAYCKFLFCKKMFCQVHHNYKIWVTRTTFFISKNHLNHGWFKMEELRCCNIKCKGSHQINTMSLLFTLILPSSW